MSIKLSNNSKFMATKFKITPNILLEPNTNVIKNDDIRDKFKEMTARKYTLQQQIDQNRKKKRSSDNNRV